MSTVLGLLPFARELFEAAVNQSDGIVAETVRLGPPVPRPGNIVGLGMTYQRSAPLKTSTADVIYFGKPTTTLIGPNDDIIYPQESKMLMGEAELVIVIGRQARNVSLETAAKCIAGYTIGNDLTMPDVIFGDALSALASANALKLQIFRGKAHDTCQPLGPYILTTDEIDRIEDVELSLEINGVKCQGGPVSDMIMSLPAVVAAVSNFMTLSPGDLILTGNPMAMSGGDGPRYLRPGDIVTASATSLGALCNPVRTTQSDTPIN